MLLMILTCLSKREIVANMLCTLLFFIQIYTTARESESFLEQLRIVLWVIVNQKSISIFGITVILD